MKSLLLSLFLPLAVAVAASADSPEVDGLSLFCAGAPAKNTCDDAFPKTLEQAMNTRLLHQEIDKRGEGIIWKMASWLDLDTPPAEHERAGHPEGFRFRAISHMAVFREFWTYEKGPDGDWIKKEWVRRTVAHVTAGGFDGKSPVLQVLAEKSADAGWKVTEFNAAAQSNSGGAFPIHWNGKLLGWIATGWSSDHHILKVDGRWMVAGLNDSMASSAINFSRTEPWQIGVQSRSFRLRWTFTLWSWPSDVQREQGYKWPSSHPDFELPEMDKP